MTIDQKYINKFIKVTSKAAIASFNLIGKQDKINADKAAVDSMRAELNKLDIKGEIVIGEGELDEAPMLYIGEKIGNMNGPEIDIAVDPLDGTNFVAFNLPGALSVIAIAEKNNLFKAPETYMEKISANVDEKDVIDLDYSIKKNIYNLSDYLNKKPEELTACLLDRPRHRILINELNKLKVKIKLIKDGDVSGALLVTDEKHNVDIFLGIGGGPECGDVMKLQIQVENDKIVDAKFKTFGCGSAIAASSLATEWIKDRTIDEASSVSNVDIVEELSLPPVKIHCSVLAEDAIKAAIADYKQKQL